MHSRSEDDRVFQNLCRGSGSGLVVIFLPLEYAFVLLQLVKICVAVAVVDDRGPRTHHSVERCAILKMLIKSGGNVNQQDVRVSVFSIRHYSL